MLPIKREYFTCRVNEMVNEFEKNKADLFILQRLKFELGFRNTLIASQLEDQVDKAIRDLGKSTSPRQESASYTNPISLYDWQKRALQAWKESEYVGVVEAVTGAGKTHVALAAIHEHISMGWKVVVVVPSIVLQEQWAKQITTRVIRYLSVPCRMAFMGGSGEYHPEYDILIAVAAGASSKILYREGTDSLLIADECHRYGATNWSRVLEVKFKRHLGLTATYDRSDNGIDEYLNPYFDGVCYSLDYQEALEDDVIAHFKVAYIAVEFDDTERMQYDEADQICRKLRHKLVESYGVPANPIGEFMKTVVELSQGGSEDSEVTKISRRYIKMFNQRRKLIANADGKFDALDGLLPSIRAAERTIIFTQTKVAAEQAVSRLKTAGLKAKVLDSTMSMDERKAIFADFENGDEDVVAAPILLDEGVDVPAADLAIVLASSRSKRQMIQRMGRVLRKKQDERLARIAILYINASMEDWTTSEYSSYEDIIDSVADAVEVFGPEDLDEACDFLNDFVN
jgi:superfamily II DNA or RNA helicase